MEFFGDITISSKSRVTLAKFLDLPEAVNHARQDFCDLCEIRHVMPLLKPDLYDEDEEFELRPAFSVMEETAESRVLIITGTGHIGFAPISTKVGDQIYLLFGSHVPIVLRPYGEKFKFIGACYIHGIMYGEGLHPNCFVNSQYYPGSNPSDEVWLLDHKYGEEHGKPHRHWARLKRAARGEKADSSNSTRWELFSTPCT